MPGVSKTQRTEAKYNVTLEFPHLGLHSAAATGNVGLVKYAIDHGQPINSVLDGVLPLHAACSGGSDLVVRLLIEKGADVNAPRLPRRYSSDKNRDTSAPIVGTSGSTPLHFACANGHITVVRTLLLHGAHPDRPDKHGVTPEMIARQNGWVACADIVQQWSQNKDKDLREKDLTSGQNRDTTAADEHHSLCGHSDCTECTSRRLRVKRSIDNALNILRPSPSQSPPAVASPSLHGVMLDPAEAPPLPSSKPFGEYTFHDTPDNGDAEVANPRRPSLPHIFEAPHTVPYSRPSYRSRSSSRRPRSAGTDAEHSPVPCKVRSKISLMNIFKKSIGDAAFSAESSTAQTSSSSVMTSLSASPSTDQRASSLSSQDRLTDISSISTEACSVSRAASAFRSRVFSESKSQSPSRPSLVSDLRHALSSERLRTRSSGVGCMNSVDLDGSLQVPRSSSVRPGILRPHGRSASSGQTPAEPQRTGSASQSSIRALRFDSTSTTSSGHIRNTGDRRHLSRSPVRGVRGSTSISSLQSEVITGGPRSPQPLWLQPDAEEYAPELTMQLTTEPDEACDSYIEEEDEEQYGEPIGPQAEKPPMDALTVDERIRRASDVSSQLSLSPLPSPGIVIPSTGFDCPFSINVPPPGDVPSAESNTLGIHGIENRLRGDSVSSTSTTASNMPPSSSSSGYLTTPALSQPQLPNPMIRSSSSVDVAQLPLEIEQKKPSLSEDETETPLARRGARVPLDLGAISSHAQAEALVQRAQQSILEMQDIEIEYADLGGSVGSGRTPLSAALAAYGESLEIERKFKLEEQRISSPKSAQDSDVTEDGIADYRGQVMASRRGLDRKFSLEERSHRVRPPRQARTTRPHTSGGTPSSDSLNTSLGGLSPSAHSIAPSEIRSEQIVVPVRTDVSHIDRAISITPRRSRHHMKGYSETLLAPRPRIPRSRTPDPDSDGLNIAGSVIGVPLSRVSTVPDCMGDIMPSRGMSDQERQTARATKLVKMGFQSPDTWQHSPSGQQRSHVGSKNSRFGIKTLVQTLKGKT
ncbi:hypothetical protein B0H21DRAFT_731219 [Amylocystis lapponica]|nr:hypothetical protein B0H21DRAFT_731219 [Amylocystis lapponica]